MAIGPASVGSDCSRGDKYWENDASPVMTEALVKDIMTRSVVTLRPNMTLREASKVLFENHVSGAPVVDDSGAIVGVLAESDILKAIKTYDRRLHMTYSSPSLLSVCFRPEYKEKELQDAICEFQEELVKDVMTIEIYVLEPEDTVTRAILILNSFGINRIPIVKGKKVVGIVTRADIIRYLGSQSTQASPNQEKPLSLK